MAGTGEQKTTQKDARSAIANIGIKKRKYDQAPKLTLERANELLNYNPDTGVILWKVDKGPAKKGSVAGTTHKRGYRHITVDGKEYKAHRIAFLLMTGKMPIWPNRVNHTNHIKDDNRWCKLEEVTAKQNNEDSLLRKDSKSGITGVHWCKTIGKWKAQIQVNKKKLSLGCYCKLIDAVKARVSAEIQSNRHGVLETMAASYLRKFEEEN